MGKQIVIYFSGYVRINVDDHPGLVVTDENTDFNLEDINPEELVGDSKYSLCLSDCLDVSDDYALDQFDVIIREE